MKGLYKFEKDCGRMGKLEGLFIAEVDKVDELIESEVEVHFGEALGKHSDVSVIMSDDNLTLVTTEENVIKVIEDYNLENGYNPFNYIYDE